ncbi:MULTISPECIES: NUDIX hydrolase [Streptomyces]|uniref:NUDIX domain-containing protein n=1 Tax=Streptomyces gilvifuscus TaxID=1550617 RepID=A0ABT5FZW3_9ACTN|nr:MULTISPECIES: NUDIX domain-containing protein [Streptomyces]MBK3646521.1 NUDIX domain-containing protein [Streptomyces sp. MBT33]MDC2958110.1 NUDIX domain-containing protein [Streptomyces gilvifuscus]
MDSVVRVGVQAIVRSADGVLLGLRKNTFGQGTWGLPGGHLEIGESIFEATARELREEVGIRPVALRVACVTDPQPEANHHMQIGVEVLGHEGHITVCEPHRCERWQFWPLDALPDALFIGSIKVLDSVRAGSLHLSAS